MSKRVKKTPTVHPAQITAEQCEEAALSLYRRGLATRAVLLGKPVYQRTSDDG